MFILACTRSLRSLFFFTTLLSIFPQFTFASQRPVICLTQIVAHPALDATRQGILDALNEAGLQDGAGAKILVENAQGSVSTALQIASKCKGVKADVIVALGTPMAQSVLKGTKGTKIPLVFSSITDPVGAKLVPRLKAPGDRVTGVSNASSREEQLGVFMEILPSMKRLGVILNPGDANALAAYKLLEKAAQKRGIVLVQGVASKTTELSQAVKSVAPRVDALFVDNDNTALSGFSSVAKVALSLKIPLFVSDIDMVPQGAVAALGPDQYKLGRQTGQMILRVLKGEDPGQMDVAFPQESTLVLNETLAKKLGLVLPDAVVAKAAQKNVQDSLARKRDNS